MTADFDADHEETERDARIVEGWLLYPPMDGVAAAPVRSAMIGLVSFARGVRPALTTGKRLVAILFRYAGERGYSESAVETLERLIREREIFATSAVVTALRDLQCGHGGKQQ